MSALRFFGEFFGFAMLMATLYVWMLLGHAMGL